MPTTKTTTLFKFNELSDKAKEKAREWYRQAASWDDNGDFDCLRDDLRDMLAIAGFELDQAYYRGFWSQGDGASFTGTYQYRKGWRKEYLDAYPVKGEDGKVEVWHQHNAKVLGYLDAIAKANRANFYDLYVTITHRGHYYHSGCMAVNVELNGNYRDRYSDLAKDSEDTIVDNFRYIADDFYYRLKEAYDWRNADEQVDEAILANEYDFTEDGQRG
jgi:hypothetical protein